MLPQATGSKQTQPTGDCSECDVLKEISFKIENLVACADKEEGDEAQEQVEEGADAAAEAEDGSGDKAKPGEECMPPVMYAMDLISVNELIDTEIKNLYNSLITELMSQTDEDKLKKLVTRSLGRVNTELKAK